jgi:hypothetical protein
MVVSGSGVTLFISVVVMKDEVGETSGEYILV